MGEHNLFRDSDYGGRGTVSIASTAENPTDLLRASSNETSRPETVSILISVTPNVPDAFDGTYQLFARISWGSHRAGARTIEVDCTNGTRVNVEAISSLSIAAYALIVADDSPTPTFDVSATCSYGSIGGPTENTITVDAGELTAGSTSAAVQIPGFSKDVTAMCSDPGAALITLNFLSTPSGPPFASATGSTGFTVRTPGNAQFVTVTSNLAEDAADFTLIFGLRI